MSEFIKVTKDREVIEVHPDALENHKQLGWSVVVEETPVIVAEKPVEKLADKKAKK